MSKLIVTSLRARGYQADPVETVADGVTYLRDRRPDLILLDLSLPDRPGWELLDIAASEGVPTLPVVVVSCQRPEATEVARYQLKACLQKPFSIPALLSTVRSAIEQ
jgi:two-component system KDP operon response regulator KdpE